MCACCMPPSSLLRLHSYRSATCVPWYFSGARVGAGAGAGAGVGAGADARACGGQAVSHWDEQVVRALDSLGMLAVAVHIGRVSTKAKRPAARRKEARDFRRAKDLAAQWNGAGAAARRAASGASSKHSRASNSRGTRQRRHHAHTRRATPHKARRPRLTENSRCVVRLGHVPKRFGRDDIMGLIPYPVRRAHVKYVVFLVDGHVPSATQRGDTDFLLLMLRCCCHRRCCCCCCCCCWQETSRIDCVHTPRRRQDVCG